MSEHFISRQDAESNLLDCAAYLAERINSVEGHAEAIAAVVSQYLAAGNVDLAAELANTVDDPFTRDRLLIAVAEKCAAIDDDEYAVQLAEAVEEPGLQSQAFERIGLRKAAKNEFEKAREIASRMADPDPVLAAIAVRKSSLGLETEALETIEDIEHAGSAVTAFVDIAVQHLNDLDAEGTVKFLDLAREEAGDIEHTEERARAYIDIGNGFTEAGRNDRAIETFDKAKATAETLDNMHRDAFLSLVAQGFARAGSVDLADRALDLVADKTHIASTLLGFSREYWKKDERGEAIEALEEAYAILESQHERETRDHKARFRLFTSIAAQFAGFEKGERGIEIAERIQDEGERTAALTQIAAILTARKEDEQARHAFRAITEDGDRVFALISMSDSKEKNEDRSGAIELLDEAAHLTDAVPQLTLRASAYSEIGKRMREFGRQERANELFGNALDTISQIRDEGATVGGLVSLGSLAGEDFPRSESVSSTIRAMIVKSVAAH